MSTGNEVPLESHVEQANISIEHADISPGARRAARRLAISLCVLVFLFLGLTAASLLYSNHQAGINRCQHAVNVRFQQADIARANATKKSAEAQIELWNALFGLHGTQAQQRAEFLRAFNDYKAKLRKVTVIQFPSKASSACAG